MRERAKRTSHVRGSAPACASLTLRKLGTPAARSRRSRRGAQPVLRLRLRSLGSRTDAGQHPGNGARVFLGSAELGAVVALDGVLPTPERYFAEYDAKVVPHADEVYRYLQLDTAGRFDAVYGRREL